MAMTPDFDHEHLDGHTIQELSAYLDAGREPPDPSIDDSPGCQLALDALERLHGMAPELLQADEEDVARVDDTWVDAVMAGIALDARAGRRIPFTSEDGDLAITEGAVRGLVRAAENRVPGAFVGRCRFDGDVTQVGAPIRVDVDVSVLYGHRVRDVSEALRAEILRNLRRHTDLVIVGVDIRVHDVHLLPVAQRGE
ncbi:alkaline shock response membrane anchor protein AmaP [Microbacterium sp. M28]|uniref:alkaline shock response membrane anchor protein AmaP n=1 Tax=Microbacterium sp. M28 TaxID=2962064 RepID=UPI0021F4E921|nr:alkaline shock response membrane anchor protein AmaP [Microbacterium sp. M28]UYO96994.1 alkaline shock response membrane anchor protein AmaP [Microbacterium sp. M28]